MSTPLVQEQKLTQNSAETKLSRTRGLRPFPKGVSGNPGGRPKTKLISEAYKRILEDEGAAALAAVVHKDAQKAKRASDRLAAVKEMTDRTEGKATQAIRITGEVDAATMARLTELADLLRS